MKAQQDLLAEFEKIADELNKVLANLEGSTLLKRLKAASREQYVIAGKIGDQVRRNVRPRGQAARHRRRTDARRAGRAAETESQPDVSTIMDDMQSYFERRHFQRFKTVLDEMRTRTPSAACGNWATTCGRETGMSIAQCEFWSDTFDRWADDLVDPAACGKCPGCKSKSSLPPCIVLEAMQILGSRSELRAKKPAAPSKPAQGLETDEFAQRCGKLQNTQDRLTERVASSSPAAFANCPTAKTSSPRRSRCLGASSEVMDEAAEILGRPELGLRGHRGRNRSHRAAAAIETDQSQRRRWRGRRFARRRRRRHDHRRGPGPDRLRA